MATDQVTSSRRQILGALTAIPAVAIAGSARALPTPNIAFDRAFAKFQRLNAAHEAYWADHVAPADARLVAIRNKWPKAYDEDHVATAEINSARDEYDIYEGRFDEMCEATFQAGRDALSVPAPNPSDILKKLEVAVSLGALDGENIEHKLVAAIRDDLTAIAKSEI